MTAAMLARTLLDTWLSGDLCRLHRELERLAAAPEPSDAGDERDRVDLLRSLARRMREASDLYEPRSGSPRTGTWLDLLVHLSTPDPRAN